MSDVEHDEVAEMLGVYALDAVETDERARIDAHLEICPKCRAELSDHLEVASALGDSGTPAPSGVWDEIAARISQDDDGSGDAPMPALDLAAIRAERERSTSAASPGRSRASRFLAVAAAAVLVVAFASMGWLIAEQQGRIDEMESAMESDSMLLDPDAEVVQLADGAGTPYATAVMSQNGRAVLIGTNLAPLPDDRTYQLWAVGPDGPVSLGMLGSEPRVVPFGMAADESTVLAITDEPAGGSPAPTSDPMATGEMADL